MKQKKVNGKNAPRAGSARGRQAAAKSSAAAGPAGATFYPGQRVKVIREGSWARGYVGTVDTIGPDGVLVLLDAKAHQGAKPFPPAYLAAAR